MSERYTQLNNYYIKDNHSNTKLSQEQAIKRLNHQDRIIRMKTELIEKLVKQNNRKEKQESIKKPFYVKIPQAEIETVNLNPEEQNKLKQEILMKALESINL